MLIGSLVKLSKTFEAVMIHDHLSISIDTTCSMASIASLEYGSLFNSLENGSVVNSDIACWHKIRIDTVRHKELDLPFIILCYGYQNYRITLVIYLQKNSNGIPCVSYLHCYIVYSIPPMLVWEKSNFRQQHWMVVILGKLRTNGLPLHGWVCLHGFSELVHLSVT